MEAPLCRLCEKRHYGTCAAPRVASEPRARPSKKRVRTTKHQPGPPAGFSDSLDTTDPVLLPVKKSDKVKESDSDSTFPDGPIPLEDFIARDFCPTCGTNLAAKRKERERRRKYMKDRRKK